MNGTVKEARKALDSMGKAIDKLSLGDARFNVSFQIASDQLEALDASKLKVTLKNIDDFLSKLPEEHPVKLFFNLVECGTKDQQIMAEAERIYKGEK